MRRILTTTESSLRPRPVLRAALLAAACALAAAPHGAAAGQEKVKHSSMLGGAVTFTLPDAWQSVSDIGDNPTALLQMKALYPAGESDESGEEKKVGAIITVSAFADDDTKSLKVWSDESYTDNYHRPPPYPDSVKLSDTFHGCCWRTIAWKGAVHGETRLSLSRLGLVGKKYVGLSVILLTDGSDPEPLRRAVADFNAMCESLKIDGKNQLDTKLDADKIMELLRAGKKK